MVVPSLFADYDAEALERRLIPLAEASSKFRELRDKALASFGGSRWTQPST